MLNEPYRPLVGQCGWLLALAANLQCRLQQTTVSTSILAVGKVPPLIKQRCTAGFGLAPQLRHILGKLAAGDRAGSHCSTMSAYCAMCKLPVCPSTLLNTSTDCDMCASIGVSLHCASHHIVPEWLHQAIVRVLNMACCCPVYTSAKVAASYYVFCLLLCWLHMLAGLHML